jgi:soluble lytic murein transglycosylase
MRVPQYEGPSVRPTPLRAEQNIRAPEAAFGGATAQALQQSGQQIGQVASLLDRRAEEHGKEDAELAAFNAYTAASEQSRKYLYEGDSAVFNRRGGQAMGSTNEGAVELKKIGDDTGGSLSSPYAQQQFHRLWARHQDSEMGAISRHEAGQRREYKDQVTAGVVATSQNQAVLRYNDENEVNSQIGLAELAIRANSKGLPPEQVDAQVKKMSSGIQRAVVLRMATDNPLAANEYYKAHADSFEAEDNVTLQRTLAPTVKRAEARVEGDKIINEVTENRSAAPATLHSAVEAVESGGDGNAESGAGAKGVMQVLDSTGQEVAGKLGVPWQPELMKGSTPEAKAYQRKIGGAYLDQQLEKYGGNRALALAAYNAGPGMVDDWLAGTNKTGKNPELLKLPDPRTGEITDAAWAAKIPFKETKQYIARVEGKIRKGGQDNIDLTRTEEMVQERFPDDPEKQDAVTSYIQRRNALREQALRDRNNEAWKQGLSHIDNGGSVDNLPPDVLENLAPGRLKDLEVREDSRIKGRDKPDNPAEFDRLMTLSVNDPEAFIAEDPTKWALPKAQVNHLIGIKAARMTKEAKEEGKVNDTKKAISLTSNLLRQAHIDPTPKDNDAKSAATMNAYTAKLMQRLDEFKEKEGRRATDSEVMAIGQDLLLPGRLSVDWWPDKDVKAFEVTPDTAEKFYVPFDKIPNNEKADIVAALGKRATNELVEQIYGAVKRGDKAMVKRLTATETAPNPVN